MPDSPELEIARAAVTGGAGFIGSTVVDQLVARGTDVLVIDDLSRGTVRNLDDALRRGARLAELDVCDGAQLEKELTAFRPDVVFHLAAQIDVRVSMERPALDAHTNVVGSINTFLAAHEAGARRVVNTSTGGAIYGETDLVPTPETALPRPLSAYGLSKRAVEEYGAWFRRVKGLDVVTLRYGNVYGPRQDPRGDAGVIAIFIDTLLAGRRPTVFGDGRQTRDYVFAEDVARANVAAGTAATLVHDEYNVGSGVEVSVLQLVATLADLLGVDPIATAPEFAPPRAGEVLRSCLDVARAQSELALSRPTPLQAGLERTVAWIQALSMA